LSAIKILVRCIYFIENIYRFALKKKDERPLSKKEKMY
jgi:hypothetical protein